jgi:acyl-coenzyme A synthetase/AMP-(fatty) acid ligase
VLGAAIRAYIVADPAAALTAQAIRAGSAALLEPHMIPSQVVFCAQLPRNPNGKVDKRALLDYLTQLPHNHQAR